MTAGESWREKIGRELRDSWDRGWAKGKAGREDEEEGPELLGDVGPYLADDETPTELRPHWDYVAKAIRIIEARVKDDVGAMADADRLQAYVRNTFDALGVSVRDESSLYVAIVTASMMVELASNGLEKGLVEPDTVAAIAQISQSFAASLIPYLPPEARA